jgi:hypothetical protein
VPIQLGEGGPLEEVGPETHKQKSHQHTLQNTEYRTQRLLRFDLFKFLKKQSLLHFDLLKFWNKQGFFRFDIKKCQDRSFICFVLISLTLLDV